jgi:hypothetical protein
VYRENPLRNVPGCFELFIDVGRHDKMPAPHRLRPVAQHPVAHVGLGPAIQLLTVTIERPRRLRIGEEPGRLCHLLDRQAASFQRRIATPESLPTPEIRQTAVDAHPRPGRDQKGVGVRNQVRDTGQCSHGPIVWHGARSLREINEGCEVHSSASTIPRSPMQRKIYPGEGAMRAT